MEIERGGQPLGKVRLGANRSPARGPFGAGPRAPLFQSGISFRRAGQSDIPALVDLRIEFLRIVKDSGLADEAEWRSHFAALFARELASGAFLAWVAEDGDRIVGASGLRLPRSLEGQTTAEGQTSAEGEILNMYTVHNYRRRGICSELLRLVIAEARALGLARLRLQPTDDGRPLYERAGFRDEDRDMVLELGPVCPKPEKK